MKFRKITSLLIASMMAFSAFSALTEAAEAAPKANVVVTQWTDADAEDYWGEPLDDGYGIFKVVFNLSDLGTISNKEKRGAINGYLLTSVRAELHAENIKLCKKASKLGSVSQSGNASDFAGVIALYNEMTLDAYPCNTGTTIDDDNHSVDDAITLDLYGPVGSTITFENCSIGVQHVVDGTFNNEEPVYTSFEIDSITLGKKIEPPVEEKELGLTIDKTTEAKKENGYIWKLNLTQKNGAQAGSFTADFTDSKGDTNTKTARNNVADFFGGEGSVEFYVGLKTARTITEFKATVADSTAEGVTASDTWTAAE